VVPPPPPREILRLRKCLHSGASLGQISDFFPDFSPAHVRRGVSPPSSRHDCSMKHVTSLRLTLPDEALEEVGTPLFLSCEGPACLFSSRGAVFLTACNYPREDDATKRPVVSNRSRFLSRPLDLYFLLLGLTPLWFFSFPLPLKRTLYFGQASHPAVRACSAPPCPQSFFFRNARLESTLPRISGLGSPRRIRCRPEVSRLQIGIRHPFTRSILPRLSPLPRSRSPDLWSIFSKDPLFSPL